MLLSTPRSWTWRHAIKDSELEPVTRHLLLTMSIYMNEVGGGCYPTTKELARATGLAERTVCIHIRKAVEAGWLEVSAHGFKGQKWKNHQYQAAWPETKGTERGSVASEGKALSLTTKGTEFDDTKALSHAQSILPVNTSNNIPQGRKRENSSNFSKRSRSAKSPMRLALDEVFQS